MIMTLGICAFSLRASEYVCFRTVTGTVPVTTMPTPLFLWNAILHLIYLRLHFLTLELFVVRYTCSVMLTFFCCFLGILMERCLFCSVDDLPALSLFNQCSNLTHLGIFLAGIRLADVVA